MWYTDVYTHRCTCAQMYKQKLPNEQGRGFVPKGYDACCHVFGSWMVTLMNQVAIAVLHLYRLSCGLADESKAEQSLAW